MEENVFFCKYDNGFLKQYDELFMLTYMYLHRYKSIEGYVNLCVKDFLLYYNYSPNRSKGRVNDKVYQTLQLMIDGGFIKYIGCYSNGGLATLENVDCNMMFTVQLLDYDEKWNPNNRFTKIMYSEVDVLRNNNVKQMGKILNLYINIKKYISADIEASSAIPFAYPSENTLSRDCGYGMSSIKSYSKTLCDVGMLYMKNFGSYLRMHKGKEIVSNSNNVYALEEKYLNEDAKDGLKQYLKLHYGFVDGFYPFCDNLPDTNSTVNKDKNEKDYSVEKILDMPTSSDIDIEETVSDECV